jgi:hypothetical protein
VNPPHQATQTTTTTPQNFIHVTPIPQTARACSPSPKPAAPKTCNMHQHRTSSSRHTCSQTEQCTCGQPALSLVPVVDSRTHVHTTQLPDFNPCYSQTQPCLLHRAASTLGVRAHMVMQSQLPPSATTVIVHTAHSDDTQRRCQHRRQTQPHFVPQNKPRRNKPRHARCTVCVYQRVQHRYQSRFAHASSTTAGVWRIVPLDAVQEATGSTPWPQACDVHRKKCGHTTLVCRDSTPWWQPQPTACMPP